MRLAFLLVLLATTARAADTYCVGGFTDGGFPQSACDAPEITKRHYFWHFHAKVTDGAHCFDCWDERDSTCITGFLREPSFAKWRAVDDYECDRLGHAPADTVFRLVENTQVVAENKAVSLAGGTPVKLRTEIVRLPPGPYAAGSPLEVTVRVVDAGGKPREASGAEITVKSADGHEVKATGAGQGDGTVRVVLTLPPGGDVSVVATGTGVKLSPGETADGAISPATTKVPVSPCRYRVNLVAPAAGTLVVGGDRLAWRASVVDLQGQPASLPSGAQVGLQVDGLTDVLRSAGKDSGNSVEGAVDLPSATSPATLALAPTVTSPANDVCPGPTVRVPLSPLGLAVPADSLPTKCYVGLPCRVEADVALSENPAARTEALKFLKDPSLKGSVEAGGDKPVDVSVTPEGHVSGEITLAAPGDLPVLLKLESGGRAVETRKTIPVRWPLKLEKPAALDLGRHRAGTTWAETCKPLDFSASRGIEEQDLSLKATRPPGCEAHLVVDAGGLRAPLEDGVVLALGADRKVSICLESAACGPDESPTVDLRITPEEKLFSNQALSVPVTYRLDGVGFFACNAGLLWTLLGAILAVIVGYGFVVPIPFKADDTIRVASKETALPRAISRRLVELAGGRTRWYRSAKVCFGSDGAALGGPSGALLVLEAGKGEVLATARGALRRMNARTRKFEDVDGTVRVSLSRNVVYEVGGLFFQLG